MKEILSSFIKITLMNVVSVVIIKISNIYVSA